MGVLLLLGPFLHSHLGVSHELGFHLHGVHAVHGPSASELNLAQLSPQESPALGVAASLPQPEDEGLVLFGLALLGVVLALWPRCVPTARAVLVTPAPLPLCYACGLPPHALAPPQS